MKVRILTGLVMVLLSGSAAVFLSRPVNPEVVVVKEGAAPGTEVIAGYKKWTRVNPEPQVVTSRVAALCAAVTAVLTNLESENPHRNKFVVVYVNDIGRAAMMEQKLPRFPVGSVIVKEKLATKESTSPELLTVMKKRDAGYDPKRGDWEYMVFDGPGQVVQASGKLEKCQACHLLEEQTDYISRAYLPYELWQKLK